MNFTAYVDHFLRQELVAVAYAGGEETRARPTGSAVPLRRTRSSYDRTFPQPSSW
ncbi:hypothetical protein ACFQ7F_42635 [Streptomyces sp. NPDC056486]|uniref:hypothetical protein n=1 Tax=Streptomyces sp. NPDC056486 TaxID=3345835 RepID=UPI0036B5D927